MDEKGKETIIAFDTLMTTNHIQMLKVFLSYLPPEQQSSLAIYIKFSELQYTMQLMRQSPGRPIYRDRRTVLSLSSLMDGSLLQQDREGVIELLDELLPYGNFKERARIQEFKNMLNSVGQIREMLAMMDMMKEMFPDGMGGSDGNGMESMFSGMSGMDPEMFAQFMQMFQSPGAESTSDTDNT